MGVSVAAEGRVGLGTIFQDESRKPKLSDGIRLKSNSLNSNEWKHNAYVRMLCILKWRHYVIKYYDVQNVRHFG